MSRIIAGSFRGRRLTVPDGTAIRPTTDRMRERVFSMLMHRRYPDMHGARVADLFAGTGVLGLEALSRGALHTTFVENSSSSIRCINANIATLGVSGEANILRISATALPDAAEPYDFIFIDPPYNKGLVEPTLDCLLSSNWIADGGVIICELGTSDELTLPGALEMIDERKQGAQRVLFLQNIPNA